MHHALLINLDHLDYAKSLDLMRKLVQLKRQRPFPHVLFLVEHEPVITLGYRAGDQEILAPEQELELQGIKVFKIERGGLATYHGPGQLVGYPIFDLREARLGLPEFVRLLEQVIISSLADFGLETDRKPGFPGVWAHGKKIASIGLSARRWITSHGLAINYAPDLSHFDCINPCGLGEGTMTSMERLLDTDIDHVRLREQVIRQFERLFHLDLEPWTLRRAEEAVLNQ
jgi:lipoyl(octanoyl) transferase